MFKIYSSRRIFASLLISSLTLFSSNIYASGFQLFEENAVSTGDYNAGGAAIAEDASTAFYNPAGLVRIKTQQLVVSVVGIDVNQNFKGTVVNNAAVTTPVGVTIIPVSRQSGDTSFGGFAPVPALHYAIPINEQFYFGLSITAPFGLKTEYSDSSFVRYAATLSEVRDIDVSPVLAVKINEKLSIGAGIDVQYIQAKLDQVVGLGALSPAIFGIPNTDTDSINRADDWVVGWHAGVLVQFSPATRVGLMYHSKVDINPTGDSKFKGPIADAVAGGTIKSSKLKGSTTLPGFAMLSGYHDINDQWAVMATVIYTQWSQFKKVTLDNVAAVTQTFGPTGIIFTPSTVTATIPQNFKDSWRFALGFNYKLNETWLLRAGAGYDEDPSVNAFRSVRLPDASRYAIAFGARVKPWEQVAIDLGYTHLFVSDGKVDNRVVVGQQVTRVDGKARTYVNLFGVQVTWNIGEPRVRTGKFT